MYSPVGDGALFLAWRRIYGETFRGLYLNTEDAAHEV